MSRILILAKSGFGKTFSIGSIPELQHKGLNPSETYIISVTSKPLTFPKSRELYKAAEKGKPETGNRYISRDPDEIVDLLLSLLHSPFKNIIVDDKI
jgi:hypothetical protein